MFYFILDDKIVLTIGKVGFKNWYSYPLPNFKFLFSVKNKFIFENQGFSKWFKKKNSLLEKNL